MSFHIACTLIILSFCVNACVFMCVRVNAVRDMFCIFCDLSPVNTKPPAMVSKGLGIESSSG